jgi:hypothetical protein
VKTIKGKNHTGTERTYQFNILNNKEGVKLFHQYCSIVATAFPYLKDYLQSLVDSFMGKEEDPDSKKDKTDVDIVALIPQIFTWDKMEDLAKRLMSKAKIDGKELDEDGFCELFNEDIIEFYVALFWAIVANYPKYILPFLDTDDKDSTQDS